MFNSNKQFLAKALVFGICFSSAGGFTQEKPTDCFRQDSVILNRAIHYCITRSRPDLPQQPHEPVVYYFHGIFDNQFAPYKNGYVDQMRALAKTGQVPSFTLVSFETEALSYYIDHGQEGRAYETWFIREFMPFIESKYSLCQERQCRGLTGDSMGGMGSFHLSINHSELFGFVANAAAVILEKNLFDPWRVWDQYFVEHSVPRWKGYFLLLNSRSAFGDGENFAKHSVIHLFSNSAIAVESLPTYYFDMGGKDMYGFYDGYHKLVKLLEQRKVVFETHFDENDTHYIAENPERSRRMLEFISRQLTQVTAF